MTDWLDKAEQAVCQGIERASIGADPDELNSLAGALAAMKWGQEGGDYHAVARQIQTSRSESKSETTASYEGVEHEGNRRQRNTGFAPNGEEDS